MIISKLKLLNMFYNFFICLISVVLDSTGKSKGFGFVRFSEESDQQKALVEMQHMAGIGRRPIKVGLAAPKR